MNTAVKETQKKPYKSLNNNGKQGFAQRGKKPFNKAVQKKKVDQNKPPYAFVILDLNDKSIDAKIIRVAQLLVHKDGETTFTESYFNCGDKTISEEAASYHHINEAQIKDKPDISTFDFTQAQNLVVWDGQVTRNIFKHNDIKKYSPLINLHSLARYLEDVPKPIKMNNYALKIMPERKTILEFKLQKPENKVEVMPQILDHIKAQYKARYDEDRTAFLVTVGRSLNKANALKQIETYLTKRKELEAKFQKNRKTENKAEQAPEAGKRVIIAAAPASTQAKSPGTKKPYKPKTTNNAKAKGKKRK